MAGPRAPHATGETVARWTSRPVTELPGCGAAGWGGRAPRCRHRVLHRGTDDHPDRRDQRGHLHPALRDSRPASRRPARRRRSCSGRTACPSRPRSRCSTWRRGPGRSRSWPPSWSAATTPTRTRPEWTEWLDRLQDHLDHYGHTVYNLDFVNPVPADDPAPLIDTIRFYLRSSGPRPVRAAAGRPWRAGNRRPPRCSAGSTRCADRWCSGRCAGPSAMAPVREDALAEVGLAWPQMRWMLAEIGDRLTAAGLLEQPDDVYWLHRDELDGRPRGRRGRRPATDRTGRGGRGAQAGVAGPAAGHSPAAAAASAGGIGCSTA